MKKKVCASRSDVTTESEKYKLPSRDENSPPFFPTHRRDSINYTNIQGKNEETLPI